MTGNDFPPYTTELSQLIDQITALTEDPNLTVDEAELRRLWLALQKLGDKRERRTA